MELDHLTEDRIDALSERGNVLLEENDDWKGAIAVWKEALHLLPAPATQWPQAAWLYASIGAAWLEGGDREQAYQAFDAAYRSEDGPTNPFILLNLGSLLRGRDDATATQLLLQAYMLEGDEIFLDGNEPDLDFLAGRVDLKRAVH